MTSRWRKPPEFPCAGHPLCPAKVDKPGQRCSVHRTWSNGPYGYPCKKCRRPIVAGELYRLIDENPLTPGHASCLANKRKDVTVGSDRLF